MKIHLLRPVRTYTKLQSEFQEFWNQKSWTPLFVQEVDFLFNNLLIVVSISRYLCSITDFGWSPLLLRRWMNHSSVLFSPRYLNTYPQNVYMYNEWAANNLFFVYYNFAYKMIRFYKLIYHCIKFREAFYFIKLKNHLFPYFHLLIFWCSSCVVR